MDLCLLPLSKQDGNGSPQEVIVYLFALHTIFFLKFFSSYKTLECQHFTFKGITFFSKLVNVDCMKAILLFVQTLDIYSLPLEIMFIDLRVHTIHTYHSHIIYLYNPLFILLLNIQNVIRHT